MAQALPPRCPYCRKHSVLVSGEVIYPHRPDLKKRKFYHCAPCDAYVGTHSKTGKPLGTLANAQLRSARSRAHDHFDRTWREGIYNRSEAYAVLATRLGIPFKNCHIGLFDLDTCRKVIELYPVDLVTDFACLD
jgi:hypothetical protein